MTRFLTIVLSAMPMLLSCGSSVPPCDHVRVSSEDVVLVEHDFEIYLTRVTTENWTGELRVFCPNQNFDEPDAAYRCLARQAREVADMLDPQKKESETDK